jgi:hypothetical protein
MGRIICKNITDFAFLKWGGILNAELWGLPEVWQFQSADPKAKEPIPVPRVFKKCLLVAKIASFSIASLNIFFIAR